MDTMIHFFHPNTMERKLTAISFTTDMQRCNFFHYRNAAEKFVICFLFCRLLVACRQTTMSSNEYAVILWAQHLHRTRGSFSPLPWIPSFMEKVRLHVCHTQSFHFKHNIKAKALVTLHKTYRLDILLPEKSKVTFMPHPILLFQTQ